jgi:GT2 family glycosyltransferase
VESKLVQYSSINKPIAVKEFTNSELEKGSVPREDVDTWPSNRKLTVIKAEKNFGFPGGCNIGIRFGQIIGSEFFFTSK